MKQRKIFFEKVKQSLLERQMELNKEIEHLSHEELTDKQVMDSGDEALSSSMEELQNSLEATEIAEVNLISEALERLKNGEYGICVDCGGPIAQRRLKAFPYAIRCIACKEQLEATE